MPEFILLIIISVFIGGMLWSDRDSQTVKYICDEVPYLVDILDRKYSDYTITVLKGCSLGCSTTLTMENPHFKKGSCDENGT